MKILSNKEGGLGSSNLYVIGVLLGESKENERELREKIVEWLLTENSPKWGNDLPNSKQKSVKISHLELY